MLVGEQCLLKEAKLGLTYWLSGPNMADTATVKAALQSSSKFRNAEFIPPLCASGQSGGMNSAFRINPHQPLGENVSRALFSYFGRPLS
jgi:hypothetical protein